MDVRSLMRQAAHLNSHRTAIIYTDGTTSEQLTFADAWTRGVRMANALLELGLNPGDRIGVLEDNSIGAQDFFAGAAAGGFVRVPLYARNSIDSHHHMLSHTGCRAVVVAGHYLDEIDAVREQLPDLEHVIVRVMIMSRGSPAFLTKIRRSPFSLTTGTSFAIQAARLENQKVSHTATVRGWLLVEIGSTTSHRWRPAIVACMLARFHMVRDISTHQHG